MLAQMKLRVAVGLVVLVAVAGLTATSSASPAKATRVDQTRLTVGDRKTSTSPRRGYVVSCQTFGATGTGGAGTRGPWFSSSGTTWDATRKVSVAGSVRWTSSFSNTVSGSNRRIVTIDLPTHTTGVFPIAASDPAYAYDRNPNNITAQSITLTIPASPTVKTTATCVGGEVGVLLTGVAIFSAFDAEGRDAGAWEVQDHCAGHPQVQHLYHYHNVGTCQGDTGTGHSPLLGYALDGFGIYGHRGTNGNELTNADLDECHGHTHAVTVGGRSVTVYHYHATYEFPYTVGCFRGTPSRFPQTGGGAPQSG
jgi:hypothetical protein